MRRSFIPVVLALMAVSVSGQADKPVDFPEGPAQWIMTAEEKREWRGVKDETRAQELIDLFWVRRDPTPGTAVNEFRAEFIERVAFADRKFQEGRRRGALTERGRVIIVLGFPKELGEEASKTAGQYSGSSGASNDTGTPGGRAIAARSVWNYDYDQAQKFGLPKIEVVFIHDGTNNRVRRDTHRNDFISALPKAVEYYVKNPDLKTVPEWARPQIHFVASTPLPDVEAMTAPLPDQPETVPATGEVARAPQPTPRPASIGKLTLVKDAFAIQPQSGADPFASMTNVEEFRTEDELGWVAEYCTGSLAPLTNVEVTLKITGLINGERINFNAPPEELVPDSIKASAGCYLVRGAVPLMGMDPANYALFVKVGQYNLTKDFRIIE